MMVKFGQRTKKKKMTLKFNRVLEVVECMLLQNFIELSAALSLSCAQRKKLRRKQYCPSLPRGQ